MTDKPMPMGRGRSRGRVLVVFILLALIYGIIALHNAGYAILTGNGGNRVDAGTGMALLSCTYFTGTETVINHTFRKADEKTGKAKCPIVSKLNTALKADEGEAR